MEIAKDINMLNIFQRVRGFHGDVRDVRVMDCGNWPPRPLQTTAMYLSAQPPFMRCQIDT